MISLYVCRLPASSELDLTIEDHELQSGLLPGSTRWERVIVPVSTDGFHIAAKDGSNNGWIAFTNPKPIGRFSYYASKLLPHGRLILTIGLLLLLLLMGIDILRLLKRTNTAGLTDLSAALALVVCLLWVWQHRQADERSFTASCYKWVGAKYYEVRRLSDSSAHFLASLWLDPDQPDVLNSLALALIGSENPQERQAFRAIQYAEQACRLSRHQDIKFMDTLGIAYAEAGRFDDALNITQRSAQMAADSGQPEVAEELRRKLDLYSLGLPYRP